MVSIYYKIIFTYDYITYNISRLLIGNILINIHDFMYTGHIFYIIFRFSVHSL